MLVPNVISKNTQKPVQVLWKRLAKNDEKLFFETLELPHKKMGDVFVKVFEHKDGYNNFRIELQNKLGKPLGKEIFSIDEPSKKIFGFDIIVEPEYRKRKFRFGELLRLSSVMEMIQNKSPHIKIYSKDSAVYFHSKYKFEPCITQFKDRDRALETIINDVSENFTDISEKARQLLAKVEASRQDAPMQRNLCVETNKLVKEYIDRALKEKKPEMNHSFYCGMDMILTEENVLKNKDFFNKLYKKQGIDYTI